MTLRLDPVVGLTPPAPAETEADVRLADVQIVLDVCIETQTNRVGARRRVADKHSLRPSTVTECVKRVHRALGAPLFASSHHGYVSGLTAAGSVFIESGRIFLTSYQILRKQVQKAADDHL